MSITVSAECACCNEGVDIDDDLYCGRCWVETLKFVNEAVDELGEVLNALRAVGIAPPLLAKLANVEKRLLGEFVGAA